MKLRKVGIIGQGHVGAHVAYALTLQGIADELVLVDKNEKKLTAEVQDLREVLRPVGGVGRSIKQRCQLRTELRSPAGHKLSQLRGRDL